MPSQSQPSQYEIAAALEAVAPRQFQESYDNSGWQYERPEPQVKAALISMDVTEAVVAEAKERGCQLIITHHPLLFKGIKRLNRSHWTGRTLLDAIEAGISLYAIHTNLDNVAAGVNRALGETLGLEDLQILAPKTEVLRHLVVFVPESHVEPLREALHAAGAGKIGQYDNCSFESEGTGRYRPIEGATPYQGTVGQPETTNEIRLEVLVPADRVRAVLAAMRAAHPYEEAAYFLHPLENAHQEIGAGMVGLLPKPMEANDFISMVSQKLGLELIRHTEAKEMIQKVAVCGGSGSFLMANAHAAGADAFLSADFKYHDFFEGEGLLLCDLGHHECERPALDTIASILREKFPTFAVHLSARSSNPVRYFRPQAPPASRKPS